MTDDIRKAFEAEFPCLALRKLEEGSYADPETARYFKMFQAGVAWKAAQPKERGAENATGAQENIAGKTGARAVEAHTWRSYGMQGDGVGKP